MELERTVILIKPDAIQRNLLGEIIRRFELKGLKIAAMKMVTLSEAILDEHYSHHKDKPFFADLKKFMMSAPVVAIDFEGENCVKAVRTILALPWATKHPLDQSAVIAMSTATNLVHASDSETSALEIQRFSAQKKFSPTQKSTNHSLQAVVYRPGKLTHRGLLLSSSCSRSLTQGPPSMFPTSFQGPFVLLAVWMRVSANWLALHWDRPWSVPAGTHLLTIGNSMRARRQ